MLVLKSNALSEWTLIGNYLNQSVIKQKVHWTLLCAQENLEYAAPTLLVTFDVLLLKTWANPVPLQTSFMIQEMIEIIHIFPS